MGDYWVTVIMLPKVYFQIRPVSSPAMPSDRTCGEMRPVSIRHISRQVYEETAGMFVANAIFSTTIEGLPRLIESNPHKANKIGVLSINAFHGIHEFNDEGSLQALIRVRSALPTLRSLVGLRTIIVTWFASRDTKFSDKTISTNTKCLFELNAFRKAVEVRIIRP